MTDKQFASKVRKRFKPIRDLLSCRDWHTSWELCDGSEMLNSEDCAEVGWDALKKTAVVRFNMDYWIDYSEEQMLKSLNNAISYTIGHELTHLLFKAYFENKEEFEEYMCNMIARAVEKYMVVSEDV